MASYPKKGDRVSVRVGAVVYRGTVVRQRKRRNFNARLQVGSGTVNALYVYRPAEEGTVWARGWTSKSALALAALVALDSSR